MINACEVSWETAPVTFYTVGPVRAMTKADPTAIAVGAKAQIQFTSNAQDGVPAYTYWWWFDDGGTSTEANPLHTYDAAGDYLVTLIVTDNLGMQFICNPYKIAIVELPLPFLNFDFVKANPKAHF